MPIIRLDHLSDEQRRAYGLVHNKLTMNSDFDFEMLANELDMVTNIDMGDFGFIETQFDPGSLFDEEQAPQDSVQEEPEVKKTVICPHCGESFEV